MWRHVPSVGRRLQTARYVLTFRSPFEQFTTEEWHKCSDILTPNLCVLYDRHNLQLQLHIFTVYVCISILLGAFAKLRKATISFVMSVCLSVCPHATRLPLDGFPWNLIFQYLSKISGEIKVSLKPDKNSGHFAWRPVSIFDRSVLLIMRNGLNKVVEKIKAHILYSITFSSKIALFMTQC